MPSLTLHLKNADATQKLGAALANRARAGDVFLLEGNLGSGKTTLAQGFIHSIIGPEAEVSSPTFNLVHQYDGNLCPIWHFDLYRIEKKQDLPELGLEDALQSGICLIEWPEIAAPLLPKDALHVKLAPEAEGRTAIITPQGAWIKRLDNAWFETLV